MYNSPAALYSDASLAEALQGHPGAVAAVDGPAPAVIPAVSPAALTPAVSPAVMTPAVSPAAITPAVVGVTPPAAAPSSQNKNKVSCQYTHKIRLLEIKSFNFPWLHFETFEEPFNRKVAYPLPLYRFKGI